MRRYIVACVFSLGCFLSVSLGQQGNLEEECNVSLGKARKFKPDLNALKEVQFDRLEDLGTDLYKRIFASISRDDDTIKIAECTLDVIIALADHLPTGEEVRISVPQMFAIANSLLDATLEQNITVYLTELAKNVDDEEPVPFVTVLAAEIANFTGKKIFSATYLKQRNTFTGQLEVANFPGIDTGENVTEIDRPTYVGSGILSIRFLNNGEACSISPRFDLPIKANKSYVAETCDGERPEDEKICSFWDSKKEAFSTKGVSKIRDNSEKASCQSNHTTSFAVLLQVSPCPLPLVKIPKYTQILSIMEDVFISASIIALILTIVVLVSFDCWLNIEGGVIYAFVAPATVVIVLNTIILCMIGRILYKAANAVSGDTMIGTRTSIKGVLILTPLMGTTWAFGFFQLDKVSAIVFSYLFVIFNSLQGVFIFVIYCLLNKEVRAVVKRYFKNHQLFGAKNSTAVTPFEPPKGGQPNLEVVPAR